MNQEDYVCSVDLWVCGRGCTGNPHNCPAKLDKEKRVGFDKVLRYAGNGRPGKVVHCKFDDKTEDNQ